MKIPKIYTNGGNGSNGLVKCSKCKKKVGNFCINDPDKFADPANNCCGTGKKWDSTNQMCIDDTSPTTNPAIVDAAVLVLAVEDAVAKSANSGEVHVANIDVVTNVLEKYTSKMVANNVATSMQSNLKDAAANGWGGDASNNVGAKILELFGGFVSIGDSTNVSNLFTAIQDAWGDVVAAGNVMEMGNGWPSVFDGVGMPDWAKMYGPNGDMGQVCNSACEAYRGQSAWTEYYDPVYLADFGTTLPFSMVQGWTAQGSEALVIYSDELSTTGTAYLAHSNVLISYISAYADRDFLNDNRQSAPLDDIAPVYGLKSAEGLNRAPTTHGIDRGGYPDRPSDPMPVFSYLTSNGEAPHYSWGEPYTLTPDHVIGYTDTEIDYLATRFGYDATNLDLASEIDDLITDFAKSVVVDEVSNQVVNKVINYGDIKQRQLTSISTPEAAQDLEVAFTEQIEAAAEEPSSNGNGNGNGHGSGLYVDDDPLQQKRLMQQLQQLLDRAHARTSPKDQKI